MSSVTESNLGLNYGWAYGESGWNTGMDDNLVKLGFTSRNQVKGILSAPPSAPSNGDAYIVGTSPTGLFSGNFGKVAIWDRTVWLFLTPKNQEVVYNVANGCDYIYENGWVLKQEDELSPYVKVKDFTFSTGYTITDQKQCLLNLADNKYYQWFGTLPKVVSAGSTPATSGGIGALLWVDRTDLMLRSYLSSSAGADLIPTLADVYVAVDLDTTGATDETGTIAALFAKYKTIKLPAGTILANINIPSGGCLLGSGMLKWDSVNAEWDGVGTLIKGTVDVSNKVGVSAGHFSIDVYDEGTNAFLAVGPSTLGVYLKRISTRANEHNYLFEQNGTLQSGANGGNIVAEDCNAYGGPNGFAIKMRNVTLIRCDSSGSSVQAYVCASDNINGASVYSRAQDVTFINCTGSGNQATLRCYTRDHFSLDNTYGVQPATGIKWRGGKLFGCTQHGAHIGDFPQVIPNRTQINCEDVSIYDADIAYNTMRGVFISNGTRITVKNNKVGSNGDFNNIDFDTTVSTRCIDIDITDNTYFNPVSGFESGVFTLNGGDTSVNASHGFSIYKTNNTSATTITSISGGKPNKPVTILINDDFTTISIAGKSLRGVGTVGRYEYDGVAGVWICTDEMMSYERQQAWAASLVVDFVTGTPSGVVVPLTGTTTSITMIQPPASHAGRSYTLRVYPGDAGDKSFSGWATSVFKFSTAVPPPATVITFGTTLLVTFYWTGTVMIATSSVVVSA